MHKYDAKSLKAEEFINNEEILETLAYAEANKDNLDFLKETLTLLRRAGCQEIEAYFKASEYAYQKEKTAEIAFGMGNQAIKKRDYASAERYLLEAADMAKDKAMK